MNDPHSAVHRTIIVVDVEGFGDRRRTTPHQLAVRRGLYLLLQKAFDGAGAPWADCRIEDRGDGVFVLAPADVPKGNFVEALPDRLAAALREHNRVHPDEARIRLRMVLHAGEVAFDQYGVTATSVNLAFRLLEASPLKSALASSPGVLALITSGWFFGEVVRNSPHLDSTTYRPVRVEVKETSTVGWISLPDAPYPPESSYLTIPYDDSTAPAPQQLPAPPRSFTGRTAELAAVTRTMDDIAEQDAAMVITAIGGTGGVGKTWLAVHWAHQHADRFPGGQLFADLRGFTPSSSPVRPAVVIRGFLDALGLDPKSIPVDLDAQVGLYRTLVAGRRMLIVLDNARDSAQVEPLLPGTPSCTVIVTSRQRLTALATAHGARPVSLDMFDEPDARELLVRCIGQDRCDAEPTAVTDLLTYCAGYPLAVRIVANRAADHPAFPLEALAEELRDEATRLGALVNDDPAASLPTVLSWSYAALSEDQARTFRLLGLAPGLDISVPAAASLVGLTTADVAVTLRALESASLVQEHMPGRYRMHDLVQLHAARLAQREDTTDLRESALRRLLSFYVRTAAAGDWALNPYRTPLDLGQSIPGSQILPLRDHSATMAWFNTEYACVRAAEVLAEEFGWHSEVWHLARGMETFRLRKGHRHDQFTVWQAALNSATHLDPWRLTHAHRSFGFACARVGRHDDALTHLHESLARAEHNHDSSTQASAHQALARAWELRENYQQALVHMSHVLHIFDTSTMPEWFNTDFWRSNALTAMGLYLAHLGDYERGFAACEAAIPLLPPNDLHSEANSRDALAYLADQTGRSLDALDHYRKALVIRRILGNTYDEADTLDHIGRIRVATGSRAEGRLAWQEALELYRHHHREADAARVAQYLHSLGSSMDRS